MSISLSIANALGNIADGLEAFLLWVITHIPQILVGVVVLSVFLAIKDQKDTDRLLYKKTDYILFFLTVVFGYIVFRNSSSSESFFAVLAHALIPAVFALVIGSIAHLGFEWSELAEIALVVGSFIGFVVLTFIFREVFFYLIALCIGIAILVGIAVFFRKHPLMWILVLLHLDK